jgi:hypothetical protein
VDKSDEIIVEPFMREVAMGNSFQGFQYIEE